jgi:hypothetical protein
MPPSPIKSNRFQSFIIVPFCQVGVECNEKNIKLHELPKVLRWSAMKILIDYFVILNVALWLSKSAQ